MLRVLMAATAVVVAGCGGGGDLSRNDKVDSAGGEVAVASVTGSFIAVLDEWAIDVPLDTLPAGRYTFRAQNSGSVTHALEIQGNGGEWETDGLAPRHTAELTVDLQPGVYEVYCPVSDTRGVHKQRGMHRTIVVR